MFWKRSKPKNPQMEEVKARQERLEEYIKRLRLIQADEDITRRKR